MPVGTEFKASNSRVLLYGNPKTMKTTWAIHSAIKAGYIVVFFNGDNGIPPFVINSLGKEELERLYIVNCVDKHRIANFVTMMSYIMQQKTVIWDDEDNQFANITKNKKHDHLVIKPSLFNKNYCVIVDSYTKLVQSTNEQFAISNNIDLSEAIKTSWNGYGEQGRWLDWFLKSMSNFPCAFIVIAHASEHERMEKDANDKTIRVPLGIWPISSSRPHGRTIGQQFSDILYTDVLLDGSFVIDTRNLHNRQGGARNIAPNIYSMSSVSLEDVIGNVGIEKEDPVAGIEIVRGE